MQSFIWKHELKGLKTEGEEMSENSELKRENMI